MKILSKYNIGNLNIEEPSYAIYYINTTIACNFLGTNAYQQKYIEYYSLI